MQPPLATVQEGQLKGYLLNDLNGEPFYAFTGIPFAKPPVGELRFKAPVNVDPWEGIRDATGAGNSCIQRNSQTFKIEGSEDCLNLNVFTKTLPQENPKLSPVMVWIHGGAYTNGSNNVDMYGPDYLITAGVVVVTVNYRLGVLGFLNFDDPSLGVTGNAALKDQTLALKWVQRNIHNFNGDSKNVTLFGESAGSKSVHFHVLSPSSKGLFHKAILQSGSALNYGVQGNFNAIDFVKFIGKEVVDEKEALEVLKDIPGETLLDYQERYTAPFYLMQTKKSRLGSVTEKPSETAFITKNPIELITSGQYNKVPLLFGYNSDEGLLLEIRNRTRQRATGKVAPEQKPNLEDFIPPEMKLEKGSEKSKLICQKLADTYLAAKYQGNKYLLATDAFYITGIIGAVKNHIITSQNPVYLYRMTLDAKLNFLKKTSNLDLPGVCHGDDLGYIFKNKLLPDAEPGSIEDITIRRFVKLWTNFAKEGNPTPDGNDLNVTWRAVEKEHLHFLDIGKELVPGVNPEWDRIELWKEIYQLSPNTVNFL